MKRFILLASFVALILAACTPVQQRDYTLAVDPYIGSGGHGHVFVQRKWLAASTLWSKLVLTANVTLLLTQSILTLNISNILSLRSI